MNKGPWELLAAIRDRYVVLVCLVISLGAWFVVPTDLMPVLASVLALGLSLTITARVRTSQAAGYRREGFWTRAVGFPLFPLVPFALLLGGWLLWRLSPRAGPVYAGSLLVGLVLIGLALRYWHIGRRRGHEE